MQVGTAWADITPSGPIHVAGQLHPRIGEYAHDPLTVNAVAFGGQVVLVSCDLLFLADAFVRQVQAECGKRFGIAASAVLIACTHTHVAPCTMDRLPGAVDPEYMAHVRKSIIDVVGRALDDMEEADLYAGAGWVEQIGFNRRGLHADGTCDMYHGSWNEDFAGLEGPRDGDVPVIFARKPNGDVKAVVTSFATHPTSFEIESFYSADLVGSVRAFLRRNLGQDVGVVYLTGAAGNTAPLQLENNPGRERPWYDEGGWKRCGMYLGSEILKVIASVAHPMPDPALELAQSVVKIPVRTYPESFDPEAMTWAPEFWVANRDMWPELLRENPVDVRLNVIRIGDAAICTNPAELYVEHGLAIREKSPARVTMVAELTDGYVGYVPTRDAFPRGGYSTWPADTSKLAEDAGERIVAETGRLLDQAFGR